MPTYTWQATTASSSNWITPNSARAPADSLFALHRADQSVSNLVLTRAGGFSVGGSETVAGIQLTALALMGSPTRSQMQGEVLNPAAADGPGDPASEYQAIEVAITLDGSSAASSWRTLLVSWLNQWRSDASFDSPQSLTSGSTSDLWGLSLSVAQVNASGFGVLVRRKSSHPGQTPGDVFLDAATLTITTSGGGGGGGGNTRMAETIRQFCLIAPEVTPGTPVLSAMRKPNSFYFDMNQRSQKGSNRPAGQKVVSHKPTLREWSEGALVDSGKGLNYTESYWLLASAMGKPSTALLTTGVNQHTFRLRQRLKDDWQYYSAACGDLDVPAEFRTVAGAFLTSLGLTFGNQDCQIDGTVMGRRLTPSQNAPTGVTEVQTITLGASVSGGTLTLIVDGKITGTIAGSANMATALQTALNATGVLGAGAVAVASVSATVYTVTFSGAAFAGSLAPLIDVAPGGNALTSATTVTIARTTRGGYAEIELVPVLPEHWEVWISDTVGNLGQSGQRMTKCFQAKVNLNRGRNPEYFAGRTVGSSFGDVAETEDTITVELSGESSSNIKRLIADSRADSRLYVRIEAVGPQIGATAFNHTLRFDMALKVSDDGGFGDQDGVHDLSKTLEPVWDDTLGGSVIATLINALPAASY